MACVPVSTGSITSGVKSITRKLVFFCFSTKHTCNYAEKAKTGWFEIRIMCPNVVIFVLVDCSFSELAL